MTKKLFTVAILFCALPAVAAPPTTNARRVQPARRDFAATLDLPCELETTDRVDLASPATGMIEAVMVDVGTRVKKGQVVARLAAPKGKPAVTIISPIDGAVANHPATPGSYVLADAPGIMAIIDTAHLRAVAAVNQSDIAKLATGQPISLTFESRPAQTIPGVLNVAFPELDPFSHLQRIEAAVVNNDGSLLPGMTGMMRVRVAERKNALMVPTAALQKNDKGIVAVTVAGSLVRRVPVRIGASDGDQTEIIDGIDDKAILLVGTNLPADGAAAP